MIKVKFGIGVYNTIFSEAVFEMEQANFLFIQKYLSLVHIIFMASKLKHQRTLKWQTSFLNNNNNQEMEKKFLNLTAFRKSLRNC